ncbi:MAG: murein biosynthesis protein MurJ [Desulfovibrio sp.]|nr:murein biosynthesis protein MurJ [Desulfovibrio sp.]
MMPRRLSRSAAPASGGILRTATMLGGYTLLSRLLGLARDMGMAWLLGGGLLADALVAAMRLPHALRRLLGEGSLSMTMTAALLRHHAPVEEATGRLSPGMAALTAALAVRLGGMLLGLTLLGLWAAPWLAALLTPGFSGPELERVTGLLYICLPYLPAAVMAAVGMAVLHSSRVFGLPALSPSIFNVVMLAFTAAAFWGGFNPAVSLAWGMLCGGLAQCCVQWWGVWRLWPKADPARAVCPDPSGWGGMAWRGIRQLPAGVAGAAAPQLSMLAAMMLASGLGEGRVAALYYAERLLELPLGLVGVCLGMASLPTLSELAVRGRYTTFAEQLAQALRWSLLLALPASAGLAAVAPPLVAALLQHGAFDQGAVRATTLALWAGIPGLPAFACTRCLLAACNALGLVRATGLSTLWAVVAALVAGWILGHWPGPQCFGADVVGMAPALGVSLGAWCQTWLLARAVRRGLHHGMMHSGQDGKQDAGLVQGYSLVRQILAASAAGLSAVVPVGLCPAAGWPWLPLILGLLAGLAAWGLALYLWGQDEVRSVLQALESRKKRHDPTV